jgi:hypothetical protein
VAGTEYLFGDLVLLRALKALFDCGISVAKLKKALELLRQREERITETGLPAQYLVTDGMNVYFRSREEIIEDLLNGGQLASNSLSSCNSFMTMSPRALNA